MNLKDIHHSLKQSGRIIVDAFFPPVCPICGLPLNMDERKTPGTIHKECKENLQLIEGPVCTKCGKQVEDDEVICSDCSKNKRHFTKSVSLFEYSDSIKKSIIMVFFYVYLI